MTERAIIGEYLLAKREIGASVSLQARQRAHEIGDCRNFRRLQDIVAPESRHIAGMGFVVARTGAVTDGLVDIGELAAPQPIVVVEVGIALGPAAAGAMARRAIIGEGHAPLRAREVE